MNESQIKALLQDPLPVFPIEPRWDGKGYFLDPLQLEAMVDSLADQAEAGNKSALAILIMIAQRATRSLHLISLDRPEAVSPFAKESAGWPVIYSYNRTNRAQVEKLIRVIGLSRDFNKDFFTPEPRRTWKRIITEKLIAWMADICSSGIIVRDVACPKELLEKLRGLPDLDLETWPEWFSVAQELLIAITGGYPERNIYLRLLGISRETHKEGAPPGTLSAEANVRAEIYIKLREAFAQIAKRHAAVSEAMVYHHHELEEFAEEMTTFIIPGIPTSDIRGMLLGILQRMSAGERKTPRTSRLRPIREQPGS